MGYWKEMRERLGGGNPAAYADRYVCGDCITDEGICDLVQAEACSASCSYCNAVSDVPIAAPILEVLLHMNESLAREYDVAENKLPFENAEGGYIGQVWTTREVLDEHLGDSLPNDVGTLMDTLCDGLGDRSWCRRSPFLITDDEKLNFSWDAFCELIKYERRYFYWREPGHEELFSPTVLLEQLAICCKRFGLFEALLKGQTFCRVRLQKAGKRLQTAADLGPPPRDMSTMANRMSPPGIVMLYGSDETETALREVARDPKQHVGRYVIGKFEILKDVQILDLTRIPPVPSIFESIPDSLEYDPRPPLIFLNYFAAELSKPVARDNQAHIDYIPAQVVTEYFRAVVVHNDTPVSGIRYPSARHRHGNSLVLFASQENLENGEDTGALVYTKEPIRWIGLQGCSEQDVSVADVRKWNMEAPQPRHWV